MNSFSRTCIALLAIFTIGCSSQQAVPEIKLDKVLEKSNRAAQQAFAKSQFNQAATLYRQALERAYLRDNLTEIVDAQYNLAICLLILQSYQPALALISQAKVELFLAEQPISADLQLLEATVFYRYGKPDDAWQITNNILSSTLENASIQSKTHFLRGLIASKRGDTDQLRIAVTALGMPTEPKLLADREELFGYLAMANQNWNAAIKAFDVATPLRRDMLDYRGMVLVLAKAGEAAEKAKLFGVAARRYLRAGRSAVLQGDTHHAQIWLTRAVQLAEQGGDEYVGPMARHNLKSMVNDKDF